MPSIVCGKCRKSINVPAWEAEAEWVTCDYCGNVQGQDGHGGQDGGMADAELKAYEEEVSDLRMAGVRRAFTIFMVSCILSALVSFQVLGTLNVIVALILGVLMFPVVWACSRMRENMR